MEELFYNDTKQVKTIDLGNTIYRDISGNQVSGTFNLNPFTSKILVKTTAVIIPDTTAPIITAFAIPATAASLTIPVSTFTATDNKSVTGFKLTETSAAPISGGAGWTSITPTSFVFATAGTKTLYAWAKDAAGNVSTSRSASVTITLPISASSPFSEYLFEETSGSTVIDSKGTNNGSIINNALRVNGVRGGGLQFTGTEYINLGQAFGGNVVNGVTLSAWLKPAATGGSWQGIITHEGPNFNTFSLYINPDLKKIGFNATGTSPTWYQWIEIANTTLWDGNWHQVTLTYNGSKKIIYLDGIALITINSTGPIDSGKGYNLFIGAASKELPASALYKGLMDEVRIYNYALTSSEINNLLNPVSTPFSEYLFEETSGTTVLDSQGPNDGTIINNGSRVAGVRGGGLQFTGTEYINLGQAFGENVVNQVTLSAWLKPAATGGSWQGIITHEGPNYNTFSLYINPNLKKIGFNATGTSPSWYQWIEIANTTLWNGNWHQVTLTYNGSKKIIYLDGIALITINSTGPIDSGKGYNLFIGAASKELPASSLYKGVMDEVRIYNYALTSSEIMNLFNLINPLSLKNAVIPESANIKPDQTITDGSKITNNLSTENTINPVESNDFVIFPNPARSSFNANYSFLPEVETRIILIDGTGRTLQNRLVESTSNSIDISQYPDGIYYVKSINSQWNITKKLVITK